MKYLASSLYYSLRDLIFSPNKSLVRNGYFIVENLLTEDLCDKLLEDITVKIDQGEISWQDKEASDLRIMGYAHTNNEFLRKVDLVVESCFEQYVGTRKSLKFFRMANVVLPKKGNKGSGGGWHRDSLNRRQLKLMIYLTDVSSNHGPFEYIKGSQRLAHKLKYNGFSSTIRFKKSDEIVTAKSDVLTASKGTGIFFDSSGVHRGNPIEIDKRVAITYYTFSNEIPSHLKKML